MERLMPSEIARLVLGYLQEENFKDLAQEFLESSRYLGECLELAREGEEITTRPYGKNLKEMLKEYCTLQKLVIQQVKKLPQHIRAKFTKLTIVEQLQQLLLLQKAPPNALSDDSQKLCTSDVVPQSQIIENPVTQSSSCSKLLLSTEVPTECEKENELLTEIMESETGNEEVLIRMPESEKEKDVLTITPESEKENEVPTKVFENENDTSTEIPDSEKENELTIVISDTEKENEMATEIPESEKGNEINFQIPENRNEVPKKILESEKEMPTKVFEIEKDVPCCNELADEIAVDSSPAPTPVKSAARDPRLRTHFNSRTSTPKKVRTRSFKRKWSKTPVKSPTSAQKLRRKFRNNAILDPLDFKVVSNVLMDNERLREKIAENINRIIIDRSSAPSDSKSEVSPSMSMDLDAMLNQYILEIVNKTELDPLFENFVDEVLAAPDLHDDTDEDPLCLQSLKRKQFNESSLNTPSKLPTDVENRSVTTKGANEKDTGSNAAGELSSTSECGLTLKKGGNKAVDLDSDKENKPEESNQRTENQECPSSKKLSTVDLQCDAAVQSIINVISTGVDNNEEVSPSESSQSFIKNRTESHSQTDEPVLTTPQTDLLLDAIRKADIIVVNDGTSETSLIPSTPARLSPQTIAATPSQFTQQVIPVTPLTQFFQHVFGTQSSQLNRQVMHMTQSPQFVQQVNPATPSQFTQNTVPMTPFTISSNTTSDSAQIIISVNNDPVPEPSNIVTLGSSPLGLSKPGSGSEPTVLMYDFKRKALVPMSPATSILGSCSPLTAASKAAMKAFVPIAPKIPKVVQSTETLETASKLPQEKLISVEANLKTGITITTEQGSSIHFSNPPGTLLGLPLIDSPISAKSVDFVSQQPSLNSAVVQSVEKEIPVQHIGLPVIESAVKNPGNANNYETATEQRTETISETTFLQDINTNSTTNVISGDNEDNMNLKNKDKDSPLKTPLVKSVVRNRSSGNKRLSLSTPRQRYRHVRALDFSTPRRSGPPSGRKSNTSPKAASTRTSPRLAGKLHRSICRGGLFSSPPQNVSSVKKVTVEEAAIAEDNSSFNSLPETCTIATRSPRESLEGPWDKVAGVGLIIDPPLTCDVVADDGSKPDSIETVVSTDLSCIKNNTTVITTAESITTTASITSTSISTATCTSINTIATNTVVNKLDETSNLPNTKPSTAVSTETKLRAWDSDLRGIFTDYNFKETQSDNKGNVKKNARKRKTDKSSPKKKSPAKKSLDKSPAKTLSKSSDKKSLNKSPAKKTLSKSPAKKAVKSRSKMLPVEENLLDKSSRKKLPAKKSNIKASKEKSEDSSSENVQKIQDTKISKQNSRSDTPAKLIKFKEVDLEDPLPSTSGTSRKSNSRKRYPNSHKKQKKISKANTSKQKNDFQSEIFSESESVDDVENILTKDAVITKDSAGTSIPPDDTGEIDPSQTSDEIYNDSSNCSQSSSVGNSDNLTKSDLVVNKRKEFIKIDVGSLTRTKGKSSKTTKKPSKSKVCTTARPQKVKAPKTSASEMLIQSPTKLNARKVNILNRRSVVCKRIICDPKSTSEVSVNSHTAETITFSKTTPMKTEKVVLEETSKVVTVQNSVNFVEEEPLTNTPSKSNVEHFPLTPRVLSPKSYQKTPNIKNTQSFSSKYDPFTTPLFPPTPSIAGTPIVTEDISETFHSPSYYNPSKESEPDVFKNVHIASATKSKVIEKSGAKTGTTSSSKKSSKTSRKSENSYGTVKTKEISINKSSANKVLPKNEVYDKCATPNSLLVNLDLNVQSNNDKDSYESDDSIDIETLDEDIDTRIPTAPNRGENLNKETTQEKDTVNNNIKISSTNNNIKSSLLESKRLSTEEMLHETVCKLKEISNCAVDERSEKEISREGDKSEVNPTNNMEENSQNINKTEKVKCGGMVDIKYSPLVSDGSNSLYKSIFSPSPNHLTSGDERTNIEDNTKKVPTSMFVINNASNMSPIEQQLALMHGEIQADQLTCRNISDQRGQKSVNSPVSSATDIVGTRLTDVDNSHTKVNSSVQSSPMDLVKKVYSPVKKYKYIYSDTSSGSSSESESSDYESDISVGKEFVSVKMPERVVSEEKVCGVDKKNTTPAPSFRKEENKLNFTGDITAKALQNTSQVGESMEEDESLLGNKYSGKAEDTIVCCKSNVNSDSNSIAIENETPIKNVLNEMSTAKVNEIQRSWKKACLDEDSNDNNQMTVSADLCTEELSPKNTADSQSVNKLFDIDIDRYDFEVNDIPLICISGTNERLMSVIYKNLGPNRRKLTHKNDLNFEQNLIVDYEGVERMVTIKPSQFISLFESDTLNSVELMQTSVPIPVDNEIQNEMLDIINYSDFECSRDKSSSLERSSSASKKQSVSAERINKGNSIYLDKLEGDSEARNKKSFLAKLDRDTKVQNKKPSESIGCKNIKENRQNSSEQDDKSYKENNFEICTCKDCFNWQEPKTRDGCHSGMLKNKKYRRSRSSSCDERHRKPGYFYTDRYKRYKSTRHMDFNGLERDRYARHDRDRNDLRRKRRRSEDRERNRSRERKRRRTHHEDQTASYHDKHSPERNRYSPERNRYSPKRYSRSPERSRQSPEINRHSPGRNRCSPERNRRSPERNRRSPERSRHSPERSRHSPERSRQSPERSRHSPGRSRQSPERSRHSPGRSRHSPERSRHSPERSRHSPERSRHSPERSRHSPGRSRHSPGRSRHSPGRSRHSPERSRRSPGRSRHSPERGRHSPERGRHSPDRGRHSPERNRESPGRSRHTPERYRHSPERNRHRSPPRPIIIDPDMKRSISNDQHKHDTLTKQDENKKRKRQEMISPLQFVYPEQSKINRRKEKPHKSHNVHDVPKDFRKSKDSRRETEKHTSHQSSAKSRKISDIISRGVRYSCSPGRNFFFRNSCERDIFQDSEVKKHILSKLHNTAVPVLNKKISGVSLPKAPRMKKIKSHDDTFEEGEITESDSTSSYDEEVKQNVGYEPHQDNLADVPEQTNSINSRISEPVNEVKEVAQSPCSNRQIVKPLKYDIAACASSVGNNGSSTTNKSECKTLPLKKRKASTENGPGKVMSQKSVESSDSKTMSQKSDVDRLESSDPKALLNKLDLDQFLSAVHGSKGS